MKPLQMTFRHIAPIVEVEHTIRSEADAMYQNLPGARHCDVTIDRPNKLPVPGARCAVRVGLAVPGVYLVAEATAQGSTPEALSTAVREAFDIVHQRALARRQKLNRQPRHVVRLPQLEPSAA